MIERTDIEDKAHRFHAVAQVVCPRIDFTRCGPMETMRVVELVRRREPELLSGASEHDVYYILYTFPKTQRLLAVVA